MPEVPARQDGKAVDDQQADRELGARECLGAVEWRVRSMRPEARGFSYLDPRTRRAETFGQARDYWQVRATRRSNKIKILGKRPSPSPSSIVGDRRGVAAVETCSRIGELRSPNLPSP